MSEDVNVPGGWGQSGDNVLELPSGGRVKVRELDVPELIQLGALDLVDTFTQKVLPKEASKKKPKNFEDKVGQDILKNPEQLEKMMVVVNKICAKAVIEPQVLYLDEGQLPKKGKIYAHLIPFEDRMEIFTKAVASMGDFLRTGGGQAEGLATVADEQGVSSDA